MDDADVAARRVCGGELGEQGVVFLALGFDEEPVQGRQRRGDGIERFDGARALAERAIRRHWPIRSGGVAEPVERPTGTLAGAQYLRLEQPKMLREVHRLELRQPVA